LRVTFVRSAAVLLSLFAFGLSGCEEKDETEPEKTKKEEPEPKTAEPEPKPDTTTTLTPEPAAPGITPRVKAELDNREDGAEGATLAATGARGTMQVPTGWTSAPASGFTVAKSQDGKAQLAAGGDVTKLEDALTALGLSECTWGATETIVVGKDKLQASAADGTCKKSGASVPAVQVTIGDASLLSVGAWEAGGDDKGLFDTLRSVKKTAGTGDSTGIAACCAALQQNSASAPPHQKGAYIAAAGACRSLISSPQGRAALAQVRAMLMGANVPASCR
jgi:hypothetical protein